MWWSVGFIKVAIFTRTSSKPISGVGAFEGKLPTCSMLSAHKHSLDSSAFCCGDYFVLFCGGGGSGAAPVTRSQLNENYQTVFPAMTWSYVYIRIPVLAGYRTASDHWHLLTVWSPRWVWRAACPRMSEACSDVGHEVVYPERAATSCYLRYKLFTWRGLLPAGLPGIVTLNEGQLRRAYCMGTVPHRAAAVAAVAAATAAAAAAATAADDDVTYCTRAAWLYYALASRVTLGSKILAWSHQVTWLIERTVRFVLGWQPP